MFALMLALVLASLVKTSLTVFNLLVSSSVQYISPGGVSRVFGFMVLIIFYIGYSVFRLKCPVFQLWVSVALFGLQLVFGFSFYEKRVFVFGSSWCEVTRCAM